MIIFLPCWGIKHIDLLRNALGKSLSWSRNKEAIKGAIWLVTTSGSFELEKIESIINEIQPDSSVVGFLNGDLNIPGIDTGMILMNTIQEAIKLCLKTEKSLLMATPDFIYGNGTIDAFKKIASEPGTCATIAHMRVLPTVTKETANLINPLNDELIDIGFKASHPSFTFASAKLAQNTTYMGGIRWWEMGEVIAVQHYMPSPFFVNFLPKDSEAFKEWHEGKPPGFGMWDHVWPTSLLEDGRLRFIGSSDIATMLEVTDEDKNVPPLDMRPGFFRNHKHNNIQKQFISCFRRA